MNLEKFRLVNKTLFAIAIGCICVLAHSNVNSGIEKANEESCRNLMKVAGMAMKARQDGTPLEAMLQAIDIVKKDGLSNEGGESFRQILIDAYSQLEYSSQEYRQRAINDFSSKYYINCMRGYGATP